MSQRRSTGQLAAKLYTPLHDYERRRQLSYGSGGLVRRYPDDRVSAYLGSVGEVLCCGSAIPLLAPRVAPFVEIVRQHPTCSVNVTGKWKES